MYPRLGPPEKLAIAGRRTGKGFVERRCGLLAHIFFEGLGRGEGALPQRDGKFEWEFENLLYLEVP